MKLLFFQTNLMQKIISNLLSFFEHFFKVQGISLITKNLDIYLRDLILFFSLYLKKTTNIIFNNWEKTLFLYYCIELLYRVYFIFFSFCSSFFITLYYKEELMYLLIKPLLTIKKEKFYFIYTNLYDMLLNEIYICFFTSLLIILPFVFYQTLNYISLISYFSTIKRIRPFLYFGLFFFNIILIFIYCYTFPFCWSFFLTFEIAENYTLFKIMLEAKIDEYIFLFFKIIFFILIFIIFSYIINLIYLYNNINIQKISNLRFKFYFFFFLLILIINPLDLTLFINIFIPSLIYNELLFFFSTFLFYLRN